MEEEGMVLQLQSLLIVKDWISYFFDPGKSLIQTQ